jgi:hypothetical protein
VDSSSSSSFFTFLPASTQNYSDDGLASLLNHVETASSQSVFGGYVNSNNSSFFKLTTKSVLGALLLLFDRAKHLQSNQDFILGTRGRPRVVCLFNFVLFPELPRDNPIFGKEEVSGIIVTLP